jgi:hypothetical protein
MIEDFLKQMIEDEIISCVDSSSPCCIPPWFSHVCTSISKVHIPIFAVQSSIYNDRAKFLSIYLTIIKLLIFYVIFARMFKIYYKIYILKFGIF